MMNAIYWILVILLIVYICYKQRRETVVTRRRWVDPYKSDIVVPAAKVDSNNAG
jgi:hypothetical protein